MIDVFEARLYIFEFIRYVDELYIKSRTFIAPQRVNGLLQKTCVQNDYSVFIFL